MFIAQHLPISLSIKENESNPKPVRIHQFTEDRYINVTAITVRPDKLTCMTVS